MKKILISDKLHTKSIEILKQHSFDVDYCTDLTPGELNEIINNFDILLVRSATKVNSELISRASNLELIGRAGAGVDNIDIEAASLKGILVMNTPGGNTISAAEHTFSMMMSLCRNIPQANQSMKEGKWEKKKFSGTELSSKILGVAGLGKIGKEVAIRAQAFEMKVIAYDPLVSQDTASKLGIKLVNLDELFSQSDIITFHVPLSPETTDLINMDNLHRLKKGIKIINCARGGVINEEAVLKGINEGIISGAAFDVFAEEPTSNFSLINNEKVICTPHLAASTEEAQEKVAIQLAEQIVEFYKGGSPAGFVNGIAIKYSTNEKLKPFIELARKLGSLHGQTLDKKCDNVEIEYYGDYLTEYSEVLGTSFLQGLLSSFSDVSVNLINAKHLANERGIRIREIKNSNHQSYINLIKVVISEKEYLHSFEGIVSGNNIRIIKVDDYKIEFEPVGNVIIYNNVDRPGVLARAGNLLAENEINIAGVSLSRIDKGSAALTIMNVDEDISNDVIQKLKSISGIEKINFVKFR
ncbi:MAG: phosphoglycerate dehydrogenase [Melioribacteraceae bacterium]|nr:phosphoglycerate dehydrogenase [Melioribacteraceae bacterium]WKZ70523.1 MAG: phosphoglycerate dehydrogenase [Melioribacteraceae bacterium]